MKSNQLEEDSGLIVFLLPFELPLMMIREQNKTISIFLLIVFVVLGIPVGM